MTIDDIFAVKQVSDPQISPDGTRVVYVVSVADKARNRWDTDLWLVNVADGAASARQLTFNPGRDNSPRWSPDGKSIAFLRARPDSDSPAAQLFLLPMDTAGEAYALSSEPLGVASFAWAPAAQRIYFTANERATGAPPPARNAPRQPMVEDADRAKASLFRLDVVTRVKTKLTDGRQHISDFAVSPDESKIIFTAAPSSDLNESLKTELYLMTLSAAGSAPKRLTENSIPENDPEWRPDGAGFIFLASATPDFKRYIQQGTTFYFDLASGTIRHVMLRGGAYPDHYGPIEQAAWIDQNNLLVSYARTTLQWLLYHNLASGSSSAISSEGLSGDFSIAQKSGTVAYVFETPEHPAEIYALTLPKGVGRALTNHNAQVSGWQLPEMHNVSFIASDKVEVSGIFLRPQGTGPFPLVTIIHGGPAGADMASFTEFANVLTGAGIAVYFPNYRGSTNYGASFHLRSVGDRNGRDARDILEGIDDLVRRGWADKDRLGVMGWSAGGVLTNWLVANDTRFRAASSGAGVSDWRLQYFLSDYHFGIHYYFGGGPWEKNEQLWERSPLRLASRVKTPTLIHCGERDERVPIEHSRAWFRALREHGVETKFIVYPGEPHGLQQPSNQRRRHEEDFQWFKKYLLGAR